ncbi:hypothetical protein GCK72_019602 [Caenorhabditis remanei]|uniref:DUF38 domain-containing protein n=1 Tax=Caenorhabditis remanei TaxID=31234 RepID=A0A6A5GEB1_CAERE|nr:hypothetical protein GCK72_019602 [Caenorhabditis remanei]KAF1753046.1 hypothetical protein GCK72_019602 [Caenorhabditis remanei]
MDSFPEFKIHAERLVLLVRDLDTSVDVVSRFESGTLHSLYLRSGSEYIAQSTKLIEHLSNTDQWKLATYINLIAFQPIRAADLKWFYHLKVFLVNLASLSGKEIQGLFDVVSKNSFSETCTLKMSSQTSHHELLKYLPPDENVSEYYYQYPSSNPQECIELHFIKKEIFIRRMPRS